MDEIAKQAHQGSVAAIVQIMNDRLTDMGVRTRAVLEKGILQVLCEAKESEQLEQSVLIPQLREILETIAPRNLRRVNICSRIAREQQLVWLEDIHRNPENEVLWSQEIVLRKANLFQKWFRKNSRPRETQNVPLTPSSPIPSRIHNLVGMVGLCTVSFLAGLAYNNWQENNRENNRENNLNGFRWTELIPFLNPSTSSVSPAASLPQPVSTASQTHPTPPVSPAQTINPTTVILPTPGAAPSPTPAKDPFVEAVGLAQAIALQGQTAQSEAEWLSLSAQWKKASELMKSVSKDDPRYNTARDRMVFYQKNSEVAKARAKEQQ